MKKILKILIFFLIIFILNINDADSIENIDISVKKSSNSIEITARIIPSKEFVEDFKAGLGKNIQILVELYRRWSIIPDEFITGVKIQRIFVSDPIKEEYIIGNLEGKILKEKRFKNSTDALDWGLKIEAVDFPNINKFESGKYYIKVTVESNIKKLPLLLEHFLFFVPKYETKIVKESERFDLP
ncbi:MAG: DUF4390 domain-containing protein [Thermodesulfovibrio sp.]|nr:DUF4390 domain-containing protein [Thermodesulfovibrio sp.]